MSTTDQEPADDRGPAIVIPGTLSSGISNVYGPFATASEATEWTVNRKHGFPFATIVILSRPEQCSIIPTGAPQ